MFIGDSPVGTAGGIKTTTFVVLIATILLSLVSNAPLTDILYEAAGASTTVGLTHSLSPKLNWLGLFIVIFTMYFGRIGPISLVVAFNLKRENLNIVKNPSEEISVG